MAEQSKKITLYIFLFALFLGLAFFIGIHMYNIYISSRASATETTKGSLDCAFSFQISLIKYTVPELSFELYSSDIENFKKVIIDADGVRTDVDLGTFIDYKQKVILKDVMIQDKFRVFPDGCEDYSIKECSVSKRECVNLR